MRKSSLRRTGAALAAVTSLALAVTACGGTTKNDVKSGGGSAAATGKADPNAAIKKAFADQLPAQGGEQPLLHLGGQGRREGADGAGLQYKEVGPSSATDTPAR